MTPKVSETSASLLLGIALAGYLGLLLYELWRSRRGGGGV